MPVYYSRVPADTPEEQRRLVLEVEEYRKKSAEGTLTRREKFFGFKIEVSQSYGILRFGSEDRFLQRYSEGFLDFEDLAHPGRTLTYPVELLRHPPSGPTRGGTAANHTMAARPTVQVSGLSPLCEHGSSATISPARGKEMRASLLQKLRPPPLVHSWDFWHDRQDRQPISQTGAEDKTEELRYEDRLVKLCEISDVKQFWEMWNNFDTTSLPMKDGVHLFKRGVKPVWEDPRNVKGGSWTFRVPKEKAKEFWKEICLLAIGEQLGEAVATNLKTIHDDICGVSYSVRFTSILITIWNRDGDHKEGIERILSTVLKQLPPELQLKESAYYYKKHSERQGFTGASTSSS